MAHLSKTQPVNRRAAQAVKIFVFIELDEAQRRRLQRAAGGGSLRFAANPRSAEIDPQFTGCAVAFGNVPAAWLERSAALRWMQLESAGFGEYRALDWQTLGKRITVTNLAGFFSEPVAQSMLAGILAHYRGIDQLARLQPAADWVGEPLRKQLRILGGATVVLFGRGSINRRFAELLAPYRCDIIRFGRDWTQPALDRGLAAADIVVCCVPETDATAGLFDEARIGRIKRGALWVNFGRGSIADERALVAALERRQLGGAVIDVSVREPLPADDPLWRAPNAILTQHSGGGSDDETGRKVEFFAGNLARYRAGEPLLNEVDFERGY